MIHFNELYITEDNRTLVVDAEIDANSVYDGCYIDKIIVDIGENCSFNGKSNNAVTVYDGSLVVGDLTGSDSITETDVEMWTDLLNIVSRQLKQDENGDWYYMADTEEYDDNGDIIREKKPVSNKIPEIIDYIIDTYPVESLINNPHPTFNSTFNGRQYTALSLAKYIIEIVGNNSIEGVSQEYLDLTGSYVAVINNFINNYLRLVQDKGSNDQGLLYTISKETHIRICKEAMDLSPLLNPRTEKDLSGHIYIVTATADYSGADMKAIEELGCMFDVAGITGVAYNGYPIYRNFLDMIENSGIDACNNLDMESMADYILNYYAFDFALRTGDWCTAWKYWQELNGASTGKSITIGGRCGCHGSY